MTVIKDSSVIVTDSSSNPGLMITTGASAPAGQQNLALADSGSAPIYVVFQSGAGITYGDFLGVFGSGSAQVGADGGLGAVFHNYPPLALAKNNTAQGIRIFAGNGAPSGTTIHNSNSGDIYIRRDTPTTANQVVYQCTVAGNPGTWVARL